MTSGSNTATGGCLCGAIRYEAHGEPLWVAHCHCADCRRACGAAFVTYAGYPLGKVQFVKDTPASANTSEGTVRQFCGACGSPMSYHASRWPDEIHIFVGTLDKPEAFTPKMHVYTKEQLPWVHLADDLPRRPETT